MKNICCAARDTHFSAFIILLLLQVHTCKENEEKLNDMLHGKVMREVELEERLEKMKAGNKVIYSVHNLTLH